MKISVALCTYNGEKFLREQIDSILNQTIKVNEIIVCDDDSKDNTQNILFEYEKKFPDIFKVHINDKNLKSVKNFEKAISICRGDIIFLSDQDDVWLPEKVECFLSVFAQNTQISVIASNAFIINENSERILKNTIWDVPAFLKKNNIVYNFFEMFTLIGNIATGANMAFKREIINTILPFPEKDFHHDEWIALVSSSQNSFYFLDNKVSSYRVHAEQQVGGVFLQNQKNEELKLIERFNVYNPHDSFRLLKRRFLILKDKKSKILSVKNSMNNHTFAEMLNTIENYDVFLKQKIKKKNLLQYLIFKLLYF